MKFLTDERRLGSEGREGREGRHGRIKNWTIPVRHVYTFIAYLQIICAYIHNIIAGKDSSSTSWGGVSDFWHVGCVVYDGDEYSKKTFVIM